MTDAAARATEIAALEEELAARATEIAALEEELAAHRHEARVRELRDQIETHKAMLAPPTREWHRVEFLTPGRAILGKELDPASKTFRPTGEWEPQTVAGEGYLVIVDGKLEAVVDLAGKELLPHEHPAPEHRVRTIHTTCPYPEAP